MPSKVVLTETLIPLVTCVNISVIGKNTSCKRNYDGQKGQNHKYSVQKDVLNNSFKSALVIKISHCLIQVNTEYDQEDPCTVYIEN